jgi:Glycosyl hydrolases family 16
MCQVLWKFGSRVPVTLLSAGLLGMLILLIKHNGGMSQTISDRALDLSNAKITFDEEFDTLSVSSRGPDTRWIAHTPWYGDFGDASFADPEPGFPFTVSNGVLNIEARKRADGKWQSGLLSSRDRDGPDGHGFAQQYGYFEMRAKLPAGPGTWPAFWLIGVDKTVASAELDIMEEYGAFPDIYHANAQVHKDGARPEGVGERIVVPSGLMSKEFNTYGAKIDQDSIIFYFNRQQVWQTPTAQYFRQPMYILLDLALGGGWPIDRTPDPSVMQVDYVKAFSW